MEWEHGYKSRLTWEEDGAGFALAANGDFNSGKEAFPALNW